MRRNINLWVDGGGSEGSRKDFRGRVLILCRGESFNRIILILILKTFRNNLSGFPHSWKIAERSIDNLWEGGTINTHSKGGGELLPVCCLGRFPHPPSLAVIPALYYLPYNCVCNKERRRGEIKSIIIDNCSEWPPHTLAPCNIWHHCFWSLAYNN